MDNKEKTLAFFKAFALVVWILAILTTSIAVWNASKGEIPGGFYCVMSVISLIANGVAIWHVGKKLFKS